MRDMPGFEADDLMGWVAAVGALRVLGEVTDQRVRLAWREHGGGWRLAADGADKPGELAELAWAWVHDQAGAWDWADRDDVDMDADTWRRGARDAEGLAAELWVAIGSDACLHPGSKRAKPPK